MLDEHSTELKWYILHTYSGYENKVKTTLEKLIENRGIQDMISDVIVPTATVETTTASGEAKTKEEKLFPSYVLVKMMMTDETWHIVRNITGATGFVGRDRVRFRFQTQKLRHSASIQKPSERALPSETASKSRAVPWQTSRVPYPLYLRIAKPSRCLLPFSDVRPLSNSMLRALKKSENNLCFSVLTLPRQNAWWEGEKFLCSPD